MHLQLIARHPSSHALFQRRAELPPNRIRWNQSNDLHRRFRHSGPVAEKPYCWGQVGMLIGTVESLSDHPIEGEVAVTIADGQWSVTGIIEVFDPSRQRIIQDSLLIVERLAQQLSANSQIQEVRVDYTQHIKDIEGGTQVA